MTMRVLGVIASMLVVSCVQGAPGDGERTATQADQGDQALESTGEVLESNGEALESTGEVLESNGEALESTGEVQQAQEALNKYATCYRVAFTTAKFTCTFKHHLPEDVCRLLAEATARTVCYPLIGVTG